MRSATHWLRFPGEYASVGPVLRSQKPPQERIRRTEPGDLAGLCQRALLISIERRAAQLGIERPDPQRSLKTAISFADPRPDFKKAHSSNVLSRARISDP